MRQVVIPSRYPAFIMETEERQVILNGGAFVIDTTEEAPAVLSDLPRHFRAVNRGMNLT